MSRVTELLGTRYPIIQGALGVLCNPELVAAVTEAGGYGLLATTFVPDGEVLRDRIRAVRRLTGKPFGVNLFVMNPRAASFVEVLAAEGVSAVTVSGGSPGKLIPRLHDAGIKAIPVVPTVAAAVHAAAADADAVVAEGTESGGVQGFRGASTMTLVPAVADAVDVPVIAAGGIGDARGYRAALSLGAEGVQVGTRFVATRECIAHPGYKREIVAAGETGTGLVDLGRFRVRVLRTPFVERVLSGQEGRVPGFSGRVFEEGWILAAREDVLLPAGEVAGSISRVLSVREVLEEMAGPLPA